MRYQLLIPDLPSADDLLPYLRRIDAARWYTNFGPLERELRARLANLVGGTVVTVASATAGLELTLAALALPRGSPVVCPAFTFPATVTAIVRAGFWPTFADVDPETWALTPELAAPFADGRRCGVVPVAPFGAGVDSNAWAEFAAADGADVVIDAAAAFGNQLVGGRNPLPHVFSLHATKCLGAGEGGFVATNDDRLARRLTRTQNFGFSAPGSLVLERIATNAKLSEYHAAVALASLDRFDAVAARRRQLAAAYRLCLELYASGVETQRRPESDVLQMMPALLPRGVPVNAVAARLEKDGIETRRWYHPPMNTHGPFYASVDLPTTRDLSNRLLGLPFHTQLREEDVELICRCLGAAISAESTNFLVGGP